MTLHRLHEFGTEHIPKTVMVIKQSAITVRKEFEEMTHNPNGHFLHHCIKFLPGLVF